VGPAAAPPYGADLKGKYTPSDEVVQIDNEHENESDGGAAAVRVVEVAAGAEHCRSLGLTSFVLYTQSSILRIVNLRNH
jgi:hypothetical protein